MHSQHTHKSRIEGLEHIPIDKQKSERERRGEREREIQRDTAEHILHRWNESHISTRPAVRAAVKGKEPSGGSTGWPWARDIVTHGEGLKQVNYRQSPFLTN